MKLPALLLAVAFATGIILPGMLPGTPMLWLSLATAALLAGFGLLLRAMAAAALLAGLAAWLLLGALAASLENAAVAKNHVTNLVAKEQLDTAEALRWRGQLRSDPVLLPWGARYEIDLQEVEIVGRAVPVSGGLRLNYFHNDRGGESPPALRAGEGVEALARARPPRNFRNPGAFDAKTHLARQDIHLTGSLRSLELLRRVETSSPTLRHRLARVRGRLLEVVDALFARAPASRAVLRAMLLGDRSFVDHEVVESFQRTSVYHILVISGLHVVALAAFVMWCARRLRLSLLQSTLVMLIILVLFVAIVEDRPPILRAALMSGVFLVSRLWFRGVDLLNTLGTAALAVLLARPSALTDPSFQLSFLAAGMIGALGLPWLEQTTAPYRRALAQLSDVTRDAAHPPRAAQLRLDLRTLAGWLAARLPLRLTPHVHGMVAQPIRIGLGLWEVAVISFAIQLGMLPVMASYFHRVALAGPLANIPASLLSGLIVPFGYLALALGAVWETLGQALVPVLNALVTALLSSNEVFNQWGWTSYRIPGPPGWLTAAFLVVLVALCASARRSHRRWQIVSGVVIVTLGTCVATYPFAPQRESDRLEITVLDVGQGDAILVALPDGRTLLVDGGGTYGAARVGGARTGIDIGEQVVSSYLWQRGVKRLDVIALTHAHTDHLDGLNAVLDNFHVGELWVGAEVATPPFRGLLQRAESRGTRVIHRQRGDSFQWGEVRGLVLWPEGRRATDRASNNDSLVLLLEYGQMAFLLPGDIEQPVEQELAARGDPLDVDFLKVPHHGSRTSITSDLVRATSPAVAAVSVGEGNPFGHPHEEVLERLHLPGVRLLRTDQDGAVTILSSGQSLRVTSYRTNSSR